MADNVQPDAGEQREESSSGLLLSVDPLQGSDNYKLSGDDSDSGKGGLLGEDTADADSSDSDSALGGDDSGGSDADASDAGGIAADSDSADAQMNPLGIGDTNVDGGSAARPLPPPDGDETDAP